MSWELEALEVRRRSNDRGGTGQRRGGPREGDLEVRVGVSGEGAGAELHGRNVRPIEEGEGRPQASWCAQDSGR